MSEKRPVKNAGKKQVRHGGFNSRNLHQITRRSVYCAEREKMTKRNKAPVDVVMPEIKLTIAGLAYMTGLLPGATRCAEDSKVTDKLKFLGLISITSLKASCL